MSKFITEVFAKNELPKKKLKKASKVNGILQEIYESVGAGKIGKIDTKTIGVHPVSLRYQTRYLVKSGVFSPGTKIIARNDSKDWYFVRGDSNTMETV